MVTSRCIPGQARCAGNYVPARPASSMLISPGRAGPSLRTGGPVCSPQTGELPGSPGWPGPLPRKVPTGSGAGGGAREPVPCPARAALAACPGGSAAAPRGGCPARSPRPLPRGWGRPSWRKAQAGSWWHLQPCWGQSWRELLLGRRQVREAGAVSLPTGGARAALAHAERCGSRGPSGPCGRHAAEEPVPGGGERLGLQVRGAAPLGRQGWARGPGPGAGRTTGRESPVPAWGLRDLGSGPACGRRWAARGVSGRGRSCPGPGEQRRFDVRLTGSAGQDSEVGGSRGRLLDGF